ncbi:MAG: LacI family DNA-binding transcriptional regulator [Thermomicrobiales bacterium]
MTDPHPPAPTRRVSIEDIARAGGVSHSTVSRALRDYPLISAATRERLQALAREMGYTPNAVAQSLQRRHTGTIGLVVTSISDPFFVDVIEGVEEVARSAGLSIFLNSSHNDPAQEIAVIENFHRRRVDGVVAAAARSGDRYAARLQRINVPVILINDQAAADRHLFHSVAVDDQAGAMLAAGHLLELGHRRIAYLGVSNRPKSNDRRFAGYRAALASAGVPVCDELIAIAPEELMAAGDVAAGQALGPRLRDAGATAICCHNDMVAVGVGLTCAVPGDVSVVGFDDNAIARYVTPPLTTIAQPKREMGRLAIEMLLALLDGRAVESRVFQPTLRVRASTAAYSRG